MLREKLNKIYISAGEPSGDLLGAELAKAFKNKFNNKITIAGTTGEHMLKAGVQSLESIDGLNVMGFVEVVKNLDKLKILEQRLFEKIIRFSPDVCILIDFPGMHFELAAKLKKVNIKCVQYVAPKVWAWGKKRVEKLKKDFEMVLGVLPFEERFFLDNDVNYKYIGSPHLERIDSFLTDHKKKKHSVPLVGILPGSRVQEINRLMPVLQECIHRLKKKNSNIKFVIPVAQEQLLFHIKDYFNYSEVINKEEFWVDDNDSNIKVYKVKNENIQLVLGGPLNVLAHCQAAICTSGTVTLECALLGVPQVAIYRTSFLSYEIAKRLVKIKYFTLPNLILDELIISEHLQILDPDKIVEEISDFIASGPQYHKIKNNYARMRRQLSSGAAQKAVDIIIENFFH